MSLDPSAKVQSRLWAKQKPAFRHVPLWALFIGTVGFFGFSPFASGTLGSAIGALAYYYIPTLQNNFILLGACVVIFILGTIATDIIELKTGEHDPGIVVIDEV